MTVSTRITNPGPLELASASARLEAGEGLILQFDSAIYQREDLQLIDGLCAKHGSQLQVRFYGHNGSCFDGQTLQNLPSVSNLSIDCLHAARNIDAIAGLGQLKRLSINVHNLADKEVLRHANLRSLCSLSLGPTKSSNLNLSHLAEFRDLESLFISGQTKGIEALSTLTSLHSLALWCIPSRTSLAFVSSIRGLAHLTIGLGGRTSIAEVEAPDLKELAVNRVRGLAELLDLGRFPGLTTLTVEDQIQIKLLEFTQSSSKLKLLKVFNCKALHTISGLEHLRELEEFRVGLTALDPAHFASAPMPPSLKVCTFFTGKDRQDRQIREALNARGYAGF